MVFLLTNYLASSDLEGKGPTSVSAGIKLANGIKAIQPTGVMLEDICATRAKDKKVLVSDRNNAPEENSHQPFGVVFCHYSILSQLTALTVWFGKGMAPSPSFKILYFIPLSVVVKSAYGSSSANTGAPRADRVAATAAAPTKDRRSNDFEEGADDDMDREKAAALPTTANSIKALVILIFCALERIKGFDICQILDLPLFRDDTTRGVVGEALLQLVVVSRTIGCKSLTTTTYLVCVGIDTWQRPVIVRVELFITGPSIITTLSN
jgi:hypothetical protein